MIIEYHTKTFYKVILHFSLMTYNNQLSIIFEAAVLFQEKWFQNLYQIEHLLVLLKVYFHSLKKRLH